MKKIIYSTILTVLLISCSKTKEWKTYKYEEFNFTVDLPYEPEVSVKTIPGDDFTYNLVVSKSPDSGYEYTSYSVFYTDFENYINSNDSASVKRFYDNLYSQKNDLNPVRILSEKKFLQFGFPAIEYVKEFAEGNQIQVSRYIFVNDKSYQLDIFYPTIKKDNPEHKRFIDSFKLGTK